MATKSDDKVTNPLQGFEGNTSTDVLAGKSVSVDDNGVVRTALGHVASEHFHRIAKVWTDAGKVQNLLDYAEEVQREEPFKKDIIVPESRIHVNSDLTLPMALKDNEKLLRFNREGLVSMVQKFYNVDKMDVGRVPSALVNYLMQFEGDYDDIARYINRHISLWRTNRGEDAKEKNVLLRLRDYNKDGQYDIRMVASDQYGVINNYEFLQMIIDALPVDDVGNAITSHFYNDGDKIYGNIFTPDKMFNIPDDSDYGIGIAYGNSETGTHKIKMRPFLYRGVCENGCIWDGHDSTLELDKRHRTSVENLEQWRDNIRNEVKKVAEVCYTYGENLAEQMFSSKKVTVPEDKVNNIIAQLSIDNNLSLKEGRAWVNGFNAEPGDTVFHVVNGLTKAAQSFEGTDRNNMESLAGQLLRPVGAKSLSNVATEDDIRKRWNKVVSNAKDLEAKTVNKYLVASGVGDEEGN